jgi:hypothetical protein
MKVDLGGWQDCSLFALEIGFPRVRLTDGQLLEGRDAWLRWIADATRRERVEVLSLLGDHLLAASEPGRARLEEWRERRHPARALAREDLRASIRERVACFGDMTGLPLVVNALERAPACVREHALDSHAFVAVGHDSRAWTSSTCFLNREGRLMTRVVALGPGCDERVVLHEVAHGWHSGGGAELGVAIGAVGDAGLRELASAEGWDERLQAWEAKEERLAEACAHGWFHAGWAFGQYGHDRVS